MQEQEHTTASSPKPQLHSINTIFICSLFFSSFIGAVLMVQNLKQLGRHVGALIVASISLGYLLLLLLPAYLGGKSLSLGFGVNFVVNVILCFFYFNRYYPGEEEYQEKVMLAGFITSGISIGVLLTSTYLFYKWLHIDYSYSLLVLAAVLLYAVYRLAADKSANEEPMPDQY